jgi:hypothetical protein
VWACIIYRWAKRKFFHNVLLVVKGSIWGALHVIDVKGESKWPIAKEKH